MQRQTFAESDPTCSNLCKQNILSGIWRSLQFIPPEMQARILLHKIVQTEQLDKTHRGLSGPSWSNPY